LECVPKELSATAGFQKIKPFPADYETLVFKIANKRLPKEE
jgi:hypothetical protein